ncbi:MAG: alanine racemase [Acidimicrobiales bacterium]
MAEGRGPPTWAEVDLRALAHNVAVLSQLVSPALLCAVVKADAYGHGAAAVARAVVAEGVPWLAVAFPEEGIELRRAGIDTPILVLVEPPPEAMSEVLAAGLIPTLYSAQGVASAMAAAAWIGRRDYPVHLKVDTGMHRVGAQGAEAVALGLAVKASGWLRLEGLWTHLAVADEPWDPLTKVQLGRFEAARTLFEDNGLVPELLHAANSAGAMLHPLSRYDLVRCGLALYGYSPGLDSAIDLMPVLSLRSRVALVRELEAGEAVSYSQRRRLEGPSCVATVPIGYADGVPRRLFDAGMEVLIGGRRRPLAGTVTMDQIMVDCGPEADVCVGDEVVLLGAQGGERVTAEDWAAALGTISWEVLCAIGPRVPRITT